VKQLKKFIAAAAFLIFSAGTALAGDLIIFPARKGEVRFNHKAHQELLKGDCKVLPHKKARQNRRF
jgi:hypothetical protein